MIPDFVESEYNGEQYEVLVPDTLDIQERAELAVNGLTGPTDTEKDYMLYFRVHFNANPPMMSHSGSDICQVKFMEALPLMRIIGGSDKNKQVDRVWMSSALRMIGPDGLVYWPSFPWAKKVDSWTEPCPEGEHYTLPLFCGRTIGAMTVYMLRDPQGPWRKEIEKVVQALDKLAIHKKDYAYFPQGGFLPDGFRPREAEIPTGIWSGLVGWTIQGLAQFYRASGYGPAKDLAAKLSRYLRYHGKYYGHNGEFLPNYAPLEPKQSTSDKNIYPFIPSSDDPYTHFQHHTVPLLGMLDHALSTGDKDLAQFVRSSFDWAKKKGNITVGYFPENIDSNLYECSEICEVAGMIGLALKLSQAGLGDYWDDADRWIRNQFAEGQLRRSDWMYRMHWAGLIFPRMWIPESKIDPLFQTIDHVPERNIGAFAGWPSANDFFTGGGWGIQHCCTGNGSRAIYYIWEHILTYNNGELKINLLLNRSSKWVDVHSYIPYEGQVDVHVKTACTLKVRIPEWVKPGEVRCNNREPRPCLQERDKLTWDGRYAIVGNVQPGEVVQIKFPINERIKDVNIEKQRYILTIKGNDVVNIDPPGRFLSLYQRDHYRENIVRWKKATWFISNENIYW